jgi:hypothetical protein
MYLRVFAMKTKTTATAKATTSVLLLFVLGEMVFE